MTIPLIPRVDHPDEDRPQEVERPVSASELALRGGAAFHTELSAVIVPPTMLASRAPKEIMLISSRTSNDR